MEKCKEKRFKGTELICEACASRPGSVRIKGMCKHAYERRRYLFNKENRDETVSPRFIRETLKNGFSLVDALSAKKGMTPKETFHAYLIFMQRLARVLLLASTEQGYDPIPEGKQDEVQQEGNHKVSDNL